MSSILFTWLFFLVGVLGVGFFVVAGLVLWGKKQDETNNMMHFCIKYFINTEDVSERCRAATALGDARDPAALLLLVDVVNDEKVEDVVRETAEEALEKMKQGYRKYRNVIEELLSAIQGKDRQKLIDIVVRSFEQEDKKYLQSAYVISHEYMAMGQYEMAREWLFKARVRNKKESIYQEQIKDSIDKCNVNLFFEGDELYRKGDYYGAKELYTMTSTALEDLEKKHFAAHLRLACVYVKIGDFVDADQSLLQALRHHHQTDIALNLIKLLQDALSDHKQAPMGEGEKLRINQCVADIMDKIAIPTPSTSTR